VSNVRAERSRRTILPNDAFDKEYGLPPVAEPVDIAFKSIAVERELFVAPLVLVELPVLDDSSRD
jgi:hypothetical protein